MPSTSKVPTWVPVAPMMREMSVSKVCNGVAEAHGSGMGAGGSKEVIESSAFQPGEAYGADMGASGANDA